MHIENIKLINFKNHISTEYSFESGINCITGKNGIGKSNLLDAIYYLSLTKSAFQSQDSLNIHKQESFFSIQAQIIRQDRKHKLLCALKQGERKVFKLDNKAYEKMSEHIGEFPCVLIAPDDMEVIKGSSESRRRFFDQLLSQFDKAYLDALIKYNQLLRQRNSLLKQFQERGRFNHSLLETYDAQMLAPATLIFETRKNFMNTFAPKLTRAYHEITEGNEEISITYDSEMHESKAEVIFRKNALADRKTARTNGGVHKDDFIFLLESDPIKKFGSQGQQKSFLLALKLAQYQTIKEDKGLSPLLLLDDIFDKLDDQRIHNLLKMIEGKHFGQIFLTDARPERSLSLLESISDSFKFIELKAGKP